jgi:hypothetical protein
LKALRIQERLLHRMQRAIAGQTLDCGYLALVGAKGRDETRVDRLAVDQHGAGAAIAGIAAFLDIMTAKLPEECPQALTGPRFR